MLVATVLGEGVRCGRCYSCFRGVVYPSRREARQARYREHVRALADGLNFTQAAHAVGASKLTGKVWRNGRTCSSGQCERDSIASEAH